MSQYQRPWRCLVNTAADKGGSIHDDQQARGLGFRGAFVPGSVVASAAMPLILERYGPEWMDGGWFSFTFITPVYDSEEVRATAEAVGEELTLRLESREKRLCCVGEAGAGFEPPWTDKAPQWGDVFPDLARNFAFPPRDIVISMQDTQDMLEAAGDDTPWYRGASPWGDAVAPPECVLPIALHTMAGTRVPLTGVKGPGIWARHQLAIREPLRYDAGYRFSQWVVGKGSSERAYFIEYQFEVAQDDRQIVIGRHQGKFLKRAA
jgi:hypothetical protein